MSPFHSMTRNNLQTYQHYILTPTFLLEFSIILSTTEQINKKETQAGTASISLLNGETLYLSYKENGPGLVCAPWKYCRKWYNSIFSTISVSTKTEEVLSARYIPIAWSTAQPAAFFHFFLHRALFAIWTASTTMQLTFLFFLSLLEHDLCHKM